MWETQWSSPVGIPMGSFLHATSDLPIPQQAASSRPSLAYSTPANVAGTSWTVSCETALAYSTPENFATQ